jgi:site-specific DNA recombinase
MKYFIYCRRSQDREDQQLLSIESQKRELLSYAKKHGLEVITIITEDMSAYKRGRPKFQWMMDQIEEGNADGILTWHLTRLSRNGADGGLIISFIDEGKIKEIRTVEKTYVNTSDDKFMMTIHFAMAKKSSDDTSAFVKNNLKTKLEKGEYPGVASYGYLNIDEHGVISGKRFDKNKQSLLEELNRPLKRIELDPIEAPLIRKIIDYALTGVYTLPMMQEEAFKLGIKGKISGKKLAKQSMIDFLSNIFYTGNFKYLGEEYEGVHDALMSQKEYIKIQDNLYKRSRPKYSKREYTYATLVHCEECNGLLSGDYQKGHHYYRCLKAKGAQSLCSNKTYIRQDVFDVEIENLLARFNIPESILMWALKYLRKSFEDENKIFHIQQRNIQMKISTEKTKLERLTSKWLSDTNIDGDLFSDEEYKLQKLSIQKEIKELEEQNTDSNHQEDNWLVKCEEFFTSVRNLKHTYHDSNTLEKRIILQSMNAKIVRTGKKWHVDLQKPFSCLLQTQVSEITSEPRISLVNQKNTLSGVEMSTWLPGLDSNQ